MPRPFADRPLGQLLAVAVIANIGIALLVVGVPPLSVAVRASRATAFECDRESLPSIKPGDWVRLTGCDTDMFHGSALADEDGRRTHRLMPVREHDASVDTPSQVVLAVPTGKAFLEAVTYSSIDGHGDAYGLSDTVAVAIGPLDWLPAFHLVHEQVESGTTDGALVLELRAVPDMRAPAAATGIGAAALLLAGVLLIMRPVVRWWLVGLACVLALASGLRMLQWYADPMRGTLVVREDSE
ncbi:MAG TPA: hypothetical protein VGQ37_02270 [Vicinamibacterales bacterium]|jgi:hypothetical protein|nr:hypothetical protein [Vicinamibacterales bacterium]